MPGSPTDTFEQFTNRIPSFAGAGLFKGAQGLGSALGGFAGSSLVRSGLGRDAGIGSSIGSTIGGLAGSFGGFLGSFLGSGIGGALGSNFGPEPTVGPNGQAWLGRGQDGLLSILGASGDNGVTQEMMMQGLGPSVQNVNRFQQQGSLPSHFQVRGGENGMDPTIELGPYMAPVLNDMSLARAMAKRGFLAGDVGEDPTQIFAMGKWQEPESINPHWRAGVQEMTMSPGGEGLGFLTFDPANAQRMQTNEHGLISGGAQPGQEQSALVEQVYGQRYVPQGFAEGGLIGGEAGGMDDSLLTTIDGEQPAALSSGEFVMPADVVSALGDGNTKAGAKQLEGLISLIRQKKYGRAKQPPRLGRGITDLLKDVRI